MPRTNKDRRWKCHTEFRTFPYLSAILSELLWQFVYSWRPSRGNPTFHFTRKGTYATLSWWLVKWHNNAITMSHSTNKASWGRLSSVLPFCHLPSPTPNWPHGLFKTLRVFFEKIHFLITGGGGGTVGFQQKKIQRFQKGKTCRRHRMAPKNWFQGNSDQGSRGKEVTLSLPWVLLVILDSFYENYIVDRQNCIEFN